MPRVGELNNCKIYKITSLNNPELVYYGHTCQTLSSRFSKHKTLSNKSSSKIIIEKGDAIIILVEDYPCESRDQAKSREAYYVLNNPCVNKCVPGRTKTEYYEDNKKEILEHKKECYELNKEHYLEENKKYMESHKERIQEYKKQYAEKNKEKIQEYKKQYHLKKKLEKIISSI